MEQNRREKRIKWIRRAIFLLIYFVLAFNTIATDRLNKKYWSVVEWNYERRMNCEFNGDEYVMSGKCRFFRNEIRAAVELFGIYYDEEHPDVAIILDIRENKFGKIHYWLAIDDDEGNGRDPNFGGSSYFDENFQPVTMYDQEPDEKLISLMNELHDEVKNQRISELVITFSLLVMGVSDPFLYNIGFKNLAFCFMGVWLYKAVNHSNPDEAVTVQQALRMCTYNGYYVTFDEKERGSLEPGKIADMVILSDDPYTMPADKLSEIKVEKLILGGKDYKPQQGGVVLSQHGEGLQHRGLGGVQGFHILVVGYELVFVHAAQHVVRPVVGDLLIIGGVALAGIIIPAGIIIVGVPRHARQHGAFPQTQVVQVVFAEIVVGGHLHAVIVLAQVNGVQIGFQDFVFGVPGFQLHGQIGFLNFALVGLLAG